MVCEWVFVDINNKIRYCDFNFPSFILRLPLLNNKKKTAISLNNQYWCILILSARHFKWGVFFSFASLWPYHHLFICSDMHARINSNTFSVLFFSSFGLLSRMRKIPNEEQKKKKFVEGTKGFFHSMIKHSYLRLFIHFPEIRFDGYDLLLLFIVFVFRFYHNGR